MDKLNRLLATLFKMNKSELDDNLTMKDIALWDSLKHMELITSIENELNIELSAEDIMAMTSIQLIRDVVSKKI